MNIVRLHSFRLKAAIATGVSRTLHTGGVLAARHCGQTIQIAAHKNCNKMIRSPDNRLIWILCDRCSATVLYSLFYLVSCTFISFICLLFDSTISIHCYLFLLSPTFRRLKKNGQTKLISRVESSTMWSYQVFCIRIISFHHAHQIYNEQISIRPCHLPSRQLKLNYQWALCHYFTWKFSFQLCAGWVKTWIIKCVVNILKQVQENIKIQFLCKLLLMFRMFLSICWIRFAFDVNHNYRVRLHSNRLFIFLLFSLK